MKQLESFEEQSSRVSIMISWKSQVIMIYNGLPHILRYKLLQNPNSKSFTKPI